MTTVYLVPSTIADHALQTIPAYVLEGINKCQVIFAENERTARRFLKSLDKNFPIEQFEWFTIHKVEQEQIAHFKQRVKEEKNIAIMSEAGCPGIADPGQLLVAIAQEMKCIVKPLVGPSSILLALMASGMNGQHFEFIGYLPIESTERIRQLKSLEAASRKDGSTKLFIETPYRNNQLLETILLHCESLTRLCIAVNLTGELESIKTARLAEWKKMKPDLHKQPAIFLLNARVS